ncbi:MAG: hypothetical protein ABIS07_09150 [Dokdonella sp.]
MIVGIVETIGVDAEGGNGAAVCSGSRRQAVDNMQITSTAAKARSAGINATLLKHGFDM